MGAILGALFVGSFIFDIVALFFAIIGVILAIICAANGNGER